MLFSTLICKRTRWLLLLNIYTNLYFKYPYNLPYCPHTLTIYPIAHIPLQFTPLSTYPYNLPYCPHTLTLYPIAHIPLQFTLLPTYPYNLPYCPHTLIIYPIALVSYMRSISILVVLRSLINDGLNMMLVQGQCLVTCLVTSTCDIDHDQCWI